MLKAGDEVVIKEFYPNGQVPSYRLATIDSINNGVVQVGDYIFCPTGYSIFSKNRWVKLLDPNDVVVKKLLKGFEGRKAPTTPNLGT